MIIRRHLHNHLAIAFHVFTGIIKLKKQYFSFNLMVWIYTPKDIINGNMSKILISDYIMLY